MVAQRKLIDDSVLPRIVTDSDYLSLFKDKGYIRGFYKSVYGRATGSERFELRHLEFVSIGWDSSA